MTLGQTSAPTGFDARRVVIAIHGGAGAIARAALTPAQEAQYRQGLEHSLRAGQKVLLSGGSAVDAVVAAVKILEDDPLFNAGRGAVFTNEGRNELDACVMDGKTGHAGAVAGVTTVKNPVAAARAVMDQTPHVLLAGQGADKFATAHQLDIVSPDYFFTQHRWDQLQKAKEQDAVQLDHDGSADRKFGTVGAVALDGDGHLAAATSTGGLTNKLYGRVGDSPIVGAGTYADNATAAISGTGTGEFFMRGLVAYDIAARMKYTGVDLAQAVEQTLQAALTQRQGQGGVIAVDGSGQVILRFNTEGMYRGFIRGAGQPVTAIYGD